MTLWRFWRKRKETEHPTDPNAPDETQVHDPRVEWEFGEDELPLGRRAPAASQHRDGLARRDHAIQRHARSQQRRSLFQRPQDEERAPDRYRSGQTSHGSAPASDAPAPTGDSSARSRRVEISAIEMPPSYGLSDEHSPFDNVAPNTTAAEPSDLARSRAGNYPAGDEERGEWDPTQDTTLRNAFRSVGAEARVRSVRQALELALDEWWSQQRLLPPPLLRNGLLVLEAGHKLDEAYLSLLLRSALRLRRGMVTALRHQTDPDRAAYLLKEALLYESSPLSTEALWRLRQENEESADWVELLHYDLEQDAQTLTGERQQLALAAMRQLESEELLLEDAGVAPVPRLLIRVTPHLWSVGRALVVVLLLFAVLSTVAWSRQRSRLVNVVLVPAGTYTVRNVYNSERIVAVPSLAVDRTEVTNRSYRLCYEQGSCPLPQGTDSATRTGYFFDPAFDFYPVVNIDWESANKHCAWADKRLPTVEEWEVAASVAPATERHYLYPWGDIFQRQYANSQLTGIGDTQQVGLYHPLGSSSFGVADMAGNVAEWTASRSGTGAGPPDSYVIKGGSYQDDALSLQTDTYNGLSADAAVPWLGFRCVATVSDDVLDGLTTR